MNDPTKRVAWWPSIDALMIVMSLTIMLTVIWLGVICSPANRIFNQSTTREPTTALTSFERAVLQVHVRIAGAIEAAQPAQDPKEAAMDEIKRMIGELVR
jgi:hypothetical protein